MKKSTLDKIMKQLNIIRDEYNEGYHANRVSGNIFMAEIYEAKTSAVCRAILIVQRHAKKLKGKK